MAVLTALERGAKVLKENQYFALATVDEKGSWSCCLAYTLRLPNRLYFFSQATSRHGIALETPNAISGVIYDSTVSAHDAESIQFSGMGYLDESYDAYAYVLRTHNESEIHESLNDKRQKLFYVTMEKAFVLNQELFFQQGIDAREEISVSHLFLLCCPVEVSKS